MLNPVGPQHVNHGLNISAHLAFWREINDMNNLYYNPLKIKELSNKSTCAATLIYHFNTMLIRSHAVSPHEICSRSLIITARYAIMGRMYFKSKWLCDRRGWWHAVMLTLTPCMDKVDIIVSIKLWQSHRGEAATSAGGVEGLMSVWRVCSPRMTNRESPQVVHLLQC